MKTLSIPSTAPKGKPTRQRIFFAVLILSILFSGCAVQKPVSNEQKIKIGVIGPLSGDAAAYGENLKAGVQLALQEYTGKQTFELLFEDDQCDGKTGSNVFHKLIDVDRVDLIIGTVCSASASAGFPFAIQENVPIINPGASANGLSQLGDTIFRIYPSDGLQGKFVAQYAFQTLNKKNAAVVYLKDDWGQAIEGIFSDEYENLGGNIVVKESMLPSEQDARGILTKIKQSNAEFVYLPVSITNGLAFVKQMQEFDMNLPIIGGDFFASEDFFTNEIVDGIMVSSGKIQNPEEFQKRIQEKTGLESVNILAPLGYDAMSIALQAIDHVGTHKNAIKYYLKDLTFNSSISSPTISFDENGDLQNAQFEMSIVRDKKLIPKE